ncbi:hypothetical protein ACVWXL_008955 [Bradyrhizobium sp. GM22.5]
MDVTATLVQKLGRMMLRLHEAPATTFPFSDRVDGYLYRLDFRLRVLMLLHRDPDRLMQSVTPSAAVREWRGSIEHHDRAVRKPGRSRGAVQLNHGAGTAA